MQRVKEKAPSIGKRGINEPCLPLHQIMRLPSPRYDTIIHYNLGARFQSRDQSPDDHYCVLIRPVVEDEAEKVHVYPLDRLFVKKIVGVEIHALSNVWRKVLLLSLRDNIMGVLDDAFDIGVVCDESLRHMAQTSADVDYSELVLGGSLWKSRSQVLWREAWEHGMPGHSVRENHGAVRHVCECSEDGQICHILQTLTLRPTSIRRRT